MHKGPRPLLCPPPMCRGPNRPYNGHMLVLFLSAFGLGLAFCAPPGAVTAEALRRGLARGFRPALLMQLGSLIGDATWAALALTGAAWLAQQSALRGVLGGLGTLVLLWLAGGALSAARRATLPALGTAPARRDFAAGALLSLTNPFALAFWLGLGGEVTAGVAQPTAVHLGGFFAGFMLAALLWCFFFAALVAGGRRVLRPAFFRAVNGLCGLALAYFGLALGWNTLHLLLG